eukprot:127188-Rhodomonas_salina.1
MTRACSASESIDVGGSSVHDVVDPSWSGGDVAASVPDSALYMLRQYRTARSMCVGPYAGSCMPGCVCWVSTGQDSRMRCVGIGKDSGTCWVNTGQRVACA